MNQPRSRASWSTKASPLRSITTFSIRPPLNGNGALYRGVTAEPLSRPTEMPSPVTQKYPGWVTMSPSPTGWSSM